MLHSPKANMTTTCAAASYLERAGTPETPADVKANHYCVNYFVAATGRTHPFTFRKDGEEILVDGRYHCSVNDARSYGWMKIPRTIMRSTLSYYARDRVSDVCPPRSFWDLCCELPSFFVNII